MYLQSYHYLEPCIQECIGLLHDEKRETVHPPRHDCQANSTGGGEDAEEARCGKTGLLHRAGQPDCVPWAGNRPGPGCHTTR